MCDVPAAMKMESENVTTLTIQRTEPLNVKCTDHRSTLVAISWNPARATKEVLDLRNRLSSIDRRLNEDIFVK